MDIGDGAGEMATALTVVPLGLPATQLAAGCHHTCAVLSDASVKCWGLNNKVEQCRLTL